MHAQSKIKIARSKINVTHFAQNFYTTNSKCHFTGLPSDDKQSLNVEEIKIELEPELLECVTKLLEDGCKQVRITAAVTLCNLNIEESKVRFLGTKYLFHFFMLSLLI